MAGGTPTLTLNDGGTATYTGGSGSNALTFSYTVAAGQNTVGLAVTAVNLNSATITDGAGNAANLSLTGLTQSGPQIDTTTPTISSLVESPASGDLNAGKTVTLTLNLNEAVTVAGGTPTLTLNDGGTATYTGGSGTNALTFSYTVGAGQNTAALAATAVNLNSATVTDGAGNAANLSLSGLTQSGPQIDTTTPTISSLVESPVERRPQCRQDRHADAQPERGGDGRGRHADADPQRRRHRHLHRRLRHQCADLQLHRRRRAEHLGARRHRRQSQLGDHHRRRRQCRQSLALRPDPERPADRHHNADHLVAGRVAGERRPQCRQDRHLDAQPERGGDGRGGTPTLTLNDGGTATYTGGSGTNALTFSYTVGAGQNTSALAATAVNLNSRDHHRRRRQCRQPLALRPDPERPADRHHNADDLVAGGVARERRPQCRQDRHADAQPERGGDGRRAAPRR